MRLTFTPTRLDLSQADITGLAALASGSRSLTQPKSLAVEKSSERSEMIDFWSGKILSSSVPVPCSELTSHAVITRSVESGRLDRSMSSTVSAASTCPERIACNRARAFSARAVGCQSFPERPDGVPRHDALPVTNRQLALKGIQCIVEGSIPSSTPENATVSSGDPIYSKCDHRSYGLESADISEGGPSGPGCRSPQELTSCSPGRRRGYTPRRFAALRRILGIIELRRRSESGL